ncbi:hypothetical protein AB0D98_30980 [Streptomyces sp. NPDC047987]
MRAAVADFGYLTGWMSMDENEQGLGQKYLRVLNSPGPPTTTSPTAAR